MGESVCKDALVRLAVSGEGTLETGSMGERESFHYLCFCIFLSFCIFLNHVNVLPIQRTKN